VQRAKKPSSSFLAGPAAGSSKRVSVASVNLLGVRVSVRAVLNLPEHRRRRSCGIAAFTDPALLGRLLELPVGCAVPDPTIWAETADQLPGVVTRGDDGQTVTRLLQPALAIAHVIVPGRRGRELRAVQDASTFASFAPRWVTLDTTEAPVATVLEAKLCGVGLIDRSGQIVLAAEQPAATVIDGWVWLLWEKAYRRWLSERAVARETESLAQATGAARVPRAG
jgi:hypothetical protein